MTKITKTGFDRYFDKQMSKPGIEESYTAARAEIDLDETVADLIEQRDAWKAAAEAAWLACRECGMPTHRAKALELMAAAKELEIK